MKNFRGKNKQTNKQTNRQTNFLLKVGFGNTGGGSKWLQSSSWARLFAWLLADLLLYIITVKFFYYNFLFFD